MKELLLVKILAGIQSHPYLEKSFVEKSEKYYNLETLDGSNTMSLDNMSDPNNLDIIFIVYSSNGDTKEPIEAYIATGRKNSRGNINYKVQYKTASSLVISSFLNNFSIDLFQDYDENEYMIKINIDTGLYNLFVDDLKPFTIPHYSTSILSNKEEAFIIAEYAQKNEHCQRIHGIVGSNRYLSGFSIDRDSIIYTRAFRRMVDKAQIYTASKGDHFRSRMTHTLEVNEIAKTIGKRLNLNNDLIEAISLAHDIGHTPFGHQGERTLATILQRYSNIKGGFKHNYQGIKILSHLEDNNDIIDGINPSYQVLEGILKHTSVKKDFDVNEYLFNVDSTQLFLDFDIPTTLEAQVVRIADEIAQRSHDVEDAFTAQHLTFDELLSNLTSTKTELLKKQIEACKIQINNRIIPDESGLQKAKVASCIVEFFVNDVCKESGAKITEYISHPNQLYIENHRFDKQLVALSDTGNLLLQHLEKIINKRVISSSEVAAFDHKAATVVNSLFDAYFENPMMLSDTALMRIYRDMRRENLETTRYRYADITLVRNELDKIKNCKEDKYIAKHKIMVRNIVDYIAGMTDTYALRQYQNICN